MLLMLVDTFDPDVNKNCHESWSHSCCFRTYHFTIHKHSNCHLAGLAPSRSLTSSLHPLRQMKRFSCLTAWSIASTAWDLLPYESSAWQSDTAPSLGGSNTSGCCESSAATCGGIQPTCAPSTSKRRQLGRHEPEERRNQCQATLQKITFPNPLCPRRTWEIEAVHSAEQLHYFLRPSAVSHFFLFV